MIIIVCCYLSWTQSNNSQRQGDLLHLLVWWGPHYFLLSTFNNNTGYMFAWFCFSIKCSTFHRPCQCYEPQILRQLPKTIRLVSDVRHHPMSPALAVAVRLPRNIWPRPAQSFIAPWALGSDTYSMELDTLVCRMITKSGVCVCECAWRGEWHRMIGDRNGVTDNLRHGCLISGDVASLPPPSLSLSLSLIRKG